MVSVDNLKVEFGVTPLFEDVSYVINKRDRIALVGKNLSLIHIYFPSDDYTYNNMSEGQALRDGKANEDSEKRENLLIAYFARLNYNCLLYTSTANLLLTLNLIL